MRYVTIGGTQRQYAIGTTYLQIAQEYQPRYDNDIILVSVDGKLRELYKTVDRDCTVEFVTAEQELPIRKRSVNTDEAVSLFERHGMYDKASLFKYRMASRVNLYSIGGFEDYFYGYMVQNTGYIRYFDLVLYEHGFVLMLPTMANPREVPEFKPSRQLFGVSGHQAVQ